MGKYMLPAILLVVGFGAAYFGWKYVSGSMAGVGGGMGRFRLGAVNPRQLAPASEFYKWQTAEGILDGLGGR